MSFKLVQGIDIPDTSGLRDCYAYEGEWITAVLSAEKLLPFIRAFTEKMKEPIFFFIELPCTDEEEKQLNAQGGERRFHYKLYYLDNCTAPVIKAILDEYGELLVNDGMCRFGFGGNESGDEIYVRSYKVVGLYCPTRELEKAAAGLLEKSGAVRQDKPVTPWDLLSKENPGTCVRVDMDGVDVFDIPALLEKAGMYYSETVDE